MIIRLKRRGILTEHVMVLMEKESSGGTVKAYIGADVNCCNSVKDKASVVLE